MKGLSSRKVMSREKLSIQTYTTTFVSFLNTRIAKMHFKDLGSNFVKLGRTSRTKHVQPNLLGSVTMVLSEREHDKEYDPEEQMKARGL